MEALVGAFNQEKALVGAFSVIVKPMEHCAYHGQQQLPAEEGGDINLPAPVAGHLVCGQCQCFDRPDTGDTYWGDRCFLY